MPEPSSPPPGAGALDLRAALRLRAEALHAVRRFFRQRGFLEADPPLLLPGVPAESTIRPFSVTLHQPGEDGSRYLPTSPESGLKQALAILQLDLFEIGHAFRNGEEEGRWHRAHFRMIEWYRLDADYRHIMRDVTDLFRHLSDMLRASRVPLDRSAIPDLSTDWEEITVQQSLRRFLGYSLDGPADLQGLMELARQRQGVVVDDWQDALSLLLAIYVHPHLGWSHPTFLTDYPTGIAAQARPHDAHPWLAEQFEVFIRGRELGNCYGELTDPVEQARRFAAETARLGGLGGGARVDPAYLEALARLPDRCAGGSLGLDRILMVLLGVDDINRVRLG